MLVEFQILAFNEITDFLEKVFWAVFLSCSMAFLIEIYIVSAVWKGTSSVDNKEKDSSEKEVGK